MSGLLGGALALFLQGCGPGRDGPPPERSNVLVLAVDTLRADRLGTYGYALPTSPRLDAFARESVVFEHAVSGASWTLPSFATLLTSLASSAHECWDKESSLGEAFVTWPEVLQAAGYETAGIASHVFFQRRYGLQQGFDTFDEELTPRRSESGHASITSPIVADRAIAWLNAHAESERPWLLWLHFFDPHFLYQVHPEFTPTFGSETEEQRYDGEIAFTDAALGRVLDALRSSGAEQRTIVILTADHGEAFGEHGTRYHGRTLHFEETHVPLIVRAPGFAPRRVATSVGTIDVMPTILELLDLAPPGALQGQSLVPFLAGESPEPVAVLSEIRLFEEHNLSGVVQGPWKLVVQRTPRRVQLFDLLNDPGETEDLSDREPAVVERLQAERKGLIQTAAHIGSAYEKPSKLELDAEQQEELDDLGYVDDE